MRYIKEKYLLILLVLYTIISIYVQFYDNVLFSRYINPLFWFIVIIYIIAFKLKKTRINNGRYYESRIVILTITYILIYFIIGFLRGFGKNPFSNTLFGLIKNTIQIIIPIIGIELLRGQLIDKNKKNMFLIIFTILIFFIVEIPMYTMYSMRDNTEYLFKYVSSNIIPIFATGLLFTYLDYKINYKLALIYRVATQLTILILPILPNMDWFITGCLNVLFPFAIYLVFKYRFFKRETISRTSKKATTTSKIVYVVVLITSSLLVSFMIGLFKYEPIAILSNSMLPVFSRGDVLIYEKMSKEQLKNIEINEIIVYRVGTQNVSHRVIEKKEENGEITYITKGDNNNAPDSRPVSVEQIIGVYKRHVKYAGFPSVWLNDFFNNEKAVVETK